MSDNRTQVVLNINAEESVRDEELETITQQLRNELLETDVESVAFLRSGEAPEGSRAGDPVTLGTLLVTLAASGGVFTTLINAIQGWLGRGEKRSITLEIDGDKLSITGSSSEEEKQLINHWINRHKKR